MSILELFAKIESSIYWKNAELSQLSKHQKSA